MSRFLDNLYMSATSCIPALSVKQTPNSQAPIYSDSQDKLGIDLHSLYGQALYTLHRL